MEIQTQYKKAVILGAAGFLGINLSHALVAQGFEVICFDRQLGWPIDHQPHGTIFVMFADIGDRLAEIAACLVGHGDQKLVF